MKDCRSRVTALRKALRARGCDYLLISDPVDVEYISGFHASAGYLLLGPRRGLLCTDFRYRGAAMDFRSRNRQWSFRQIGERPYAPCGEVLGRGGRLGVQSRTLTLFELERLKKECPGVSCIPVDDDVTAVTAVKTDAEIAAMRRAARVADRALADFLPHLKRGIREREAARTLERFCGDRGSRIPSFDTIVLFGKRSALPHGVPGARQLKPGDFVLIDFGCMVDGFCSDMTRTFVFGTPTPRQRTMYRTVAAAQARARSRARTGMIAATIDELARAEITRAGFGGAFGHATGHGIGRRVHERPRIGATDRTVIAKNMVFTVEPGIYLPDIGGVRIEDTVVAGPGRLRTLSHTSRELRELPL